MSLHFFCVFFFLIVLHHSALHTYTHTKKVFCGKVDIQYVCLRSRPGDPNVMCQLVSSNVENKGMKTLCDMMTGHDDPNKQNDPNDPYDPNDPNP